MQNMDFWADRLADIVDTIVTEDRQQAQAMVSAINIQQSALEQLSAIPAGKHDPAEVKRAQRGLRRAIRNCRKELDTICTRHQWDIKDFI